MATSLDSAFASLPSLTSLITIKLEESNYLLWKTQWVPTLHSQDLFGHVDGTVSPPPPATDGGDPNPEFLQWQRLDSLLMSCLMSTMTEETCVLVIGLETALQIWQKCETQFLNPSRYRELRLRKQLLAMEKGDDLPMMEYLARFKYACASLAAIGSPMEDSDKIAMLLRGLGRRYDTIVAIIMAQSPVPTYEQAVLMVLDYDLHLRPLSASAEGTTPGAPARNPPSGATRCQICRRRNHTGSNCWYRYDQQADQPGSPRPPSSPAPQAPETLTFERRSVSDVSATASGDNLQMGPPEWSSMSTEASE